VRGRPHVRIMVLSLICMIMLCSRFPNSNPADSGYDGDYRLSPVWTSLPDTLEVFRAYTLPCTTGADTFAGFSGGGRIDSLLMIDSYRQRTDSLALYFVSPLSGDFTLCGVRPNTRTVCAAAVGLTVSNAYVLRVDTVVGSGEPVEAGVARLDGGTVPDSFDVIWSLDGDVTQYRVLLREGAGPDSSRPQDILADWKSGFRVSDDSFYNFMYRSIMTDNNPNKGYYHQVHARDARGSVNAGSLSKGTFSY